LEKFYGKAMWYIISNVIMPRSQQNIEELNKASREAGLGKRILVLKLIF